MRAAGRFPKRAGREFVKNLIWVLVVFGPLTTLVLFAAGIPLLWVLAFVVVSMSAMAAIHAVLRLWSGAHDETFLSGHNHHPGSPPTVVETGPVAVGPVAAGEEETGAVASNP